MKKKALTLLTLTLLTTTITGLLYVNSANAFERVLLPVIYINSDGSITPPDTGYITRDGTTYTLTSDLTDQSIEISCSDIVFDGQGHTIRITIPNAQNDNYIHSVTNVTIKNLKIHTNYIAVKLGGCSNCTVTNVTSDEAIDLGGSNNNTIENCVSEIFASFSDNNLILRNNITGIYVGTGNFNVFSQNNILFVYSPDTFFSSKNYWDNGSVGNFWSDYKDKYAGASEIGNTGIGDTPYTIDQDNIDHYPLMYPVDIIATLQPSPAATQVSPIAQPAQEPAKGLSLPADAIIIVFAASIVIAAIALTLYKKKKSTKKPEGADA